MASLQYQQVPCTLSVELLYSTHTYPPLLPHVFIFSEEGGPQVSNTSVTWELFLEMKLLRLSSDPLTEALWAGRSGLCSNKPSGMTLTHAGVRQLVIYSISALPCSLHRREGLPKVGTASFLSPPAGPVIRVEQVLRTHLLVTEAGAALLHHVWINTPPTPPHPPSCITNAASKPFPFSWVEFFIFTNQLFVNPLSFFYIPLTPGNQKQDAMF